LTAAPSGAHSALRRRPAEQRQRRGQHAGTPLRFAAAPTLTLTRARAAQVVRESAGAESVAAVERDGAALLRFARDGGAKVGPLRFALFRHGQHDVRGVGFSAPAPANATVLAVPRALVLTGLDVAWTRTYAPGAWLLRGGGAPPPPLPLVLSGHAASLTPY